MPVLLAEPDAALELLEGQADLIIGIRMFRAFHAAHQTLGHDYRTVEGWARVKHDLVKAAEFLCALARELPAAPPLDDAP